MKRMPMMLALGIATQTLIVQEMVTRFPQSTTPLSSFSVVISLAIMRDAPVIVASRIAGGSLVVQIYQTRNLIPRSLV